MEFPITSKKSCRKSDSPSLLEYMKAYSFIYYIHCLSFQLVVDQLGGIIIPAVKLTDFLANLL